MSAKDLLLEKKIKAEAEVGSFDEILVQLDSDLKSEHDLGVAEGKASMGETGEPSDKLYSQVELDAKLSELSAGYGTQIAGLQEQITELGNGQAAAVTAAVSAAVSKLKSEFKTAWEMSQSEEAAAEAKVAALFAEAPAPVEPTPEVPVEAPVETPSEEV